MGKPYHEELQILSDTYNWAMREDLTALKGAVRRSWPWPLMSVGSGGSMATAHWIAYLHRRLTGSLAATCTPLELRDIGPGPRDWAIWLISAEGNNSDICMAAEHAARLETRHIVTLCGNPKGLLCQVARHFALDSPSIKLPVEKDGFLATNSTIGLSVLLARAYLTIAQVPESLDHGLFLTPSDYDSTLLDRYRAICKHALSKEYLYVLYTPSSSLGAIDLEGRFSEAALGCVQTADFRNFAHGRHYWLARYPSQTGVLALVTPDYADLANQTLAQLPEDLTVARLELPRCGINGQLASLVLALHVTDWAAQIQGIDPGQPPVPKFGRNLYSLSVEVTHTTRSNVIRDEEAVSIERKACETIEVLTHRNTLDRWRTAYRLFCEKLSSTDLSAVVFDYDGTLVTRQDRFNPPTDAVVTELKRLLDAGIWIGIATGRGKSVRKDLRAVLPESLWARILIGYYNGSQIADLGSSDVPDSTPQHSGLAELAKVLMKHDEIVQIAHISHKSLQIEITLREQASFDTLWDRILVHLESDEFRGIRPRRSSHSIDLLAPEVNKVSVVRAIADFSGVNQSQILRIGDRGHWPGNDWEMLAHPLGLSVDEVSADPTTCWHIAARGLRGIAATIAYCQAMRPTGANSGPMRLEVKRLHNES